MPSLWFVMPAHGRHQLASICMRQLRRTCDALTEYGVEATAVVVADDENLDVARDLGFATVTRDNTFLSRKFNDGIQLALDPRHNPRPADYVVPIGSDDWVDHRLFHDLPQANTMYGFKDLSFVRPDGGEIMFTHLDEIHVGGCGIRIYPRRLIQTIGFRPADEDRNRACDTSILTTLRRHNPRMRIEHRPCDPRQIVDWKSQRDQVTSYETICSRHRGQREHDPFAALKGWHPEGALDEMRSFYGALVAA